METPGLYLILAKKDVDDAKRILHVGLTKYPHSSELKTFLEKLNHVDINEELDRGDDKLHRKLDGKETEPARESAATRTAFFILANKLEVAGYTTDARSILEMGLKHYPDDGEIEEKLQQTAQSLIAAKTQSDSKIALAKTWKEYDECLKLAAEACSKKDFGKAEQFLANAVRIHPTDEGNKRLKKVKQIIADDTLKKQEHEKEIMRQMCKEAELLIDLALEAECSMKQNDEKANNEKLYKKQRAMNDEAYYVDFAKKYFDSGNTKMAIFSIDHGLSLLPGNTTLKVLLEQFMAYKEKEDLMISNTTEMRFKTLTLEKDIYVPNPGEINQNEHLRELVNDFHIQFEIVGVAKDLNDPVYSLSEAEKQMCEIKKEVWYKKTKQAKAKTITEYVPDDRLTVTVKGMQENVKLCTTEVQVASSKGNPDNSERLLNKAEQICPTQNSRQLLKQVKAAAEAKTLEQALIHEPVNKDSKVVAIEPVKEQMQVEENIIVESQNMISARKCLKLADGALKSGNIEKAIRMLEKAKRLDPDQNVDEKLDEITNAVEKDNEAKVREEAKRDREAKMRENADKEKKNKAEREIPHFSRNYQFQNNSFLPSFNNSFNRPAGFNSFNQPAGFNSFNQPASFSFNQPVDFNSFNQPAGIRRM